MSDWTLPCRAVIASLRRADDYNKRLKVWQTVSPGGDTPFGERINLYTGELTFAHTDVSFPGIGPDISIARYTITSQEANSKAPFAFGNWDIALPRIETIVARFSGWKVLDGNDTTDARCTKFTAAFRENASGITLITENGESQPLLKRAPENPAKPALTDAAGQPVPFTALTNGNWQVGCLPATTNGEPGEAFLVVSPDGTRYWMTHLTYSEVEESFEQDNGVMIRTFLDLARMSVTRIEDRFGNWVTFNYAGDKLTTITAKDGRRVDVAWRSDVPVISSVTMQAADAPPRTWQYQYAIVSGSAGLTGVILPDGSSWQFNGIGRIYQSPSDSRLDECTTRDASPLLAGNPHFGTVVSPSGLTGTFETKLTWHGRSYVQSKCAAPSGGGEIVEGVPPIFGAMALLKRTISGAGIPAAQTWSYAYSPAQGSTVEDACAIAGTCPETAWVDVTDPEGNKVRHTYSTRWGVGEGRSTRIDTYEGASTLLRTETMTYASPSQGPWPTRVGISLDSELTNKVKQEVWAPMSARNIAQQGVNFQWSAPAFDEYAKPVTETRQTTGGVLKTDTTTYRHNTAKWILGQVAQTTSKGDTITTPVITSRITYTNDLPTTVRKFEKVTQTLSYNADGTVSTVADGRNNVTTFSNWKRGIPRLMTFADTTTKSAEVDDLGQITWVIDENGYKTCYAFDVMGRLSKITYPSNANPGTCGTDQWNPLVRSFAKRAANDPDLDFDLGPNHWIERVNTGNGYTVTHYDALWRPSVVERYDATDAATKVATLTRSATRYDSNGAVVYQSYPTQNLTTWKTIAPGTYTEYDALGRPVLVQQDSELGVLESSTNYSPTEFKTESTNARGKVTTTSYQTFDQPSTDAPTTIVHPAGAYTIIDRDLFGKPKTLTRRDGLASVITTRTYSYNSAQELCRTIEPETGSTFMGYDAAGNVSWSAAGYSTPGTACLDAASVAGRRSDRIYDQRNRLTELLFADDLGEQVWEYTPDGLPRRITAYNGIERSQPVITTYAYNNRRMIGGQGETSQQTGWYLFALGAGFDRNGSLTNNVYTGGEVVDYAPNALGQATKVGAYANSVRYHPNGAIAGFNYGNGLGHSLDQNLRGLPDRSRDAYGTNVVLDDSYDYDENGNVVAISDGLAGGRGDRDMAYDDLDRLTSAASTMFGGTINYTYDVLDNLQTVSGAGRDLRYCYNSTTKRLEFLRTGASNCFTGSATTSFGFDVQGNLAWKNQQNFKFSHDNRLRESVGVATYRYDGQGRRVSANNPTAGGDLSWMYSVDGKLRRMTDARRMKVQHYMYLGESLVAIREQDFSGNLLGIKYQHTDALGSPVAVTDAATNVIERSEYEPYGKLLNRPINDAPGFTGHVQDADTGLTYMQQRYYDSSIGRFLSVDPVTAYEYPVTNFNRYFYALNNPYKFTDPDGRFFFLLPLVPPVVAAAAEAAVVTAAVVTAAWAGSKAIDAYNSAANSPTDRPKSEDSGKRRKNRIPDRGEPGTIQHNPPGTTGKQYGQDGWVEIEWNDGHGPDAPEGEQDDHVHDHEPNPNHPEGRPTRQPGRTPTPEERNRFKPKPEGQP